MLQELVDYLIFDLFGLTEGSRLAESLNFFIYDSIKILLLLYFMILAIGFFRTYIPQSKIKKWLGNTRFGLGHLTASLFGAITPFCSCSSIPIFMSMMKAGVPLGVTFSFLTTSPLINEYLVVLMLGFFGVKITLLYIVSGLVIGTLSGLVIGHLKLEHYIEKDFKIENEKEVEYKTLKSRLDFGLSEASSIVKSIWMWVLIGVGVGAAIHGFVPEETIHSLINAGGIFTVPLAVLLGIPLYANCAAIVPIAVVLFQKGVPIGTALAFMMSTAALSLPEAVILRRVMRIQLIIAFFAIVAVAIVLTGILFNTIQAVMGVI